MPSKPEQQSLQLLENDPAEKMRDLITQITRHNDLYYTHNRPQISDAEYDALFDALLKLEKKHPTLVSSDSPTQRVGAPIKSGARPAQHLAPMLSLHKLSDDDRHLDRLMKTWTKKAIAVIGDSVANSLLLGDDAFVPVWMQPKIDGVALSFRYEKGKLVRIATRGDGTEGEECTHNRSLFHGMPDAIDGAPDVLEVRGEAYMTRADFEAWQTRRKAEGIPRGAAAGSSARNVVAGAVRAVHRHPIASCEFGAYAAVASEDVLPRSHAERLAWLQKRGVSVIAEGFRATSRREIDEAIDRWPRDGSPGVFAADVLPYEADGIVLRVDDWRLYEALGTSRRTPAGACAWKPGAPEFQTVLKEVIWDVSRTGRLTPVGIMAPVLIDGVKVTRASLANPRHIARLDIAVGDVISVRRAGNVIPQIMRVIEKCGDVRPVPSPTACVCEGAVASTFADDSDEAPTDLRCARGRQCPSALAQHIAWMCQPGCLDIDGLSETRALMFCEQGWIREPADLFRLRRYIGKVTPEFLKEHHLGGQHLERICDAIDAKREVTWPRFLLSLGIPGVGPETVDKMTVLCSTMEELRAQADTERILVDDSAVSLRLTNTRWQILSDALSKLSVLHGAQTWNLPDRWSQSITDVEALKQRMADERALRERLGVDKKTEPSSSLMRSLGPAHTMSIVAYFDDEQEQEWLKALQSQVTVSGAQRGPQSGALDGKKVVITGTIEGMTRIEAKRLVTELGATNTGSVSVNVDLVVVGQGAGGKKVTQIEELGIKTISGDEFRQLVESSLPNRSTSG